MKTLVLSHFVPGGPGIPDATWREAVRPHFAGEIVVGGTCSSFGEPRVR